MRPRTWPITAQARICLGAFFSVKPLGVLPMPDEMPDEWEDWGGRTDVLRGGVARGALAGGNLSLVAALCGTPWQLRAARCILLLEHVREPPADPPRLNLEP